MQFEWDEAKNRESIRKHQIDFADVPAMFGGEMLIELDDSFDYGEDRSLVWNRFSRFWNSVSSLDRTSKKCNPNHFSAKSQPS
jgi:uncharacterized DUF497 family protein